MWDDEGQLLFKTRQNQRATALGPEVFAFTSARYAGFCQLYFVGQAFSRSSVSARSALVVSDSAPRRAVFE